jgi:hypothetical protein
VIFSERGLDGLQRPALGRGPVWRRSRDLLGLNPVFFKQIRPNAVKNSQFPDVLTDANGTFRRPATW